jgi:hypothetical protein
VDRVPVAPRDTFTRMGHVSIETTAGYMHPLVDKATNPLDDLLKG